MATFSTLSIDELGSGYTLQATSSDGLTSLPSLPITVSRTPAASLEITSQPPSTVTVESPFSFQVTALDQFGNPDGDFTGPITVALASGPTNQLMTTTMLTVNAVGGVATFTGLSVDLVGSGYSLAVSSPNLTGATSNTFSVVAGPATQLVVTTEPKSSVAAGTQFGFVVTAEDQYGNLATSFDGNETISVLLRAKRRGPHRRVRSDGDQRGRHDQRPDPHHGRQRVHFAGFRARARILPAPPPRPAPSP